MVRRKWQVECDVCGFSFPVEAIFRVRVVRLAEDRESNIGVRCRHCVARLTHYLDYLAPDLAVLTRAY